MLNRTTRKRERPENGTEARTGSPVWGRAANPADLLRCMFFSCSSSRQLLVFVVVLLVLVLVVVVVVAAVVVAFTPQLLRRLLSRTASFFFASAFTFRVSCLSLLVVHFILLFCFCCFVCFVGSVTTRNDWLDPNRSHAVHVTRLVRRLGVSHCNARDGSHGPSNRCFRSYDLRIFAYFFLIEYRLLTLARSLSIDGKEESNEELVNGLSRDRVQSLLPRQGVPVLHDHVNDVVVPEPSVSSEAIGYLLTLTPRSHQISRYLLCCPARIGQLACSLALVAR
jgi:hypothetical protein